MRAWLHVFLYARWQLRSGKGRVLECNDQAAKSAQRRPSWEWISAVGACPLDQRMNAVLTSESIHQRTAWCVSGAANQNSRVAVGAGMQCWEKSPSSATLGESHALQTSGCLWKFLQTRGILCHSRSRNRNAICSACGKVHDRDADAARDVPRRCMTALHQSPSVRR